MTEHAAAEQAESQLLADAIKETTAILRRQVEGVLVQLDQIEELAARLGSSADWSGERAADAIRRHSLDCGIKLGWVAKAVAMYREALGR
jgi:hypothetical protein